MHVLRWDHRPGLDGLRGVAVLAVLAYHGGVTWLPGGFLGVDVFLVLSGYLITALLLAEWAATGGADLRAFWTRRLRRLVPAAAVLVLAVVVVSALADRGRLDLLRGDVVATLSWVENWHLIAGDASYFDRLGDLSPLRHAWSLAVEMQWYLVWPPVVLFVLHRARGRVALVGVVAGAGAIGSAVAMRMLFDPAADPSRAYFGTDTRVHTLLVGAVLAVWLHLRDRRPGRRRPAIGQITGIVGSGLVALAMTRAGDLDPRLYQGGFLVIALAAATVIAAAREGAVGAAFAWRPLAGLGRISYGVYLWHWPLILWITPERSGLTGGRLFLVQAAASVVAAAVSAKLVEAPARRGGHLRWRVTWFAPASVAGVAAVAIVFSGLSPPARPLPAPGIAEVSRLEPPTAGPGVAVVPADRLAETRRRAADAATAGRPLRVLIAGDSVGLSLGAGFRPGVVGGRLSVDFGATTLGCSLISGTPLNRGVGISWETTQCDDWRDRWQEAAARFQPDVVLVVLGAWEVLDRRVDGRTLRAGAPAYAAEIETRVLQAAAGFESEGAAVVAVTAPCFRPHGEPPGRATTDRADDQRVAWFNGVIEGLAGRAGLDLFDLGARWCPGGQPTDVADGVRLRSDGVHFTPAGADLVWGLFGAAAFESAPA